MDLSILRKRALVLSGGMMLSVVAFAQDVIGTVTDSSGEPVIGASVLVKGTQNGVVTDINGKFSLKNVKDGADLVVSYVGFTTQTVKAGKNVSITLKDDNLKLDELVVVGYGQMKKSDVTGALARVDGEQLKAMPVRNALEGMQGKAAGVDITSSQRPGEVGGINIRGVRSLNAQNGPLYVVDGMVLQADGGISGINPSDIESVDILKDASATAIYGSRGANGVVLITTKKGKAGKTTVNYSGTVTFETLHNVSDPMSAAEWLDYSRMAKYSQGKYDSTIENGKVVPVEAIDQSLYGGVPSSWANIAQAYSNGKYDPSKVGGYDWAAQGKRTGITHEHTLSVSGGTEKFQGYGSFGYLNQEGVQPGQEYTRYTSKVSFDAKPLPYFSMGTTINGSFGEQDYGYSFTKSTTGAGDYYNALRGMLPWTSPYDENGEFVRLPNGDVNIINPLNELNLNLNQRKTFKINGSFYAQLDFGGMWKPLEGLRYRMQFGPEFRYFEMGQLNKYGSINSDNTRKTTWNHYQSKSWVLDNLIYYDRTIAEKHKIGVTLMQSASKFHTDNINASNSNIQTDDEMWYNIGTPADKATIGSGYSEYQMTSYMIRANYNYDEKYMLTASVRWDGSSVLAPGHKWATFPSVAAGWRIDQENFMEGTRNWLDQLKLRVGVGVTGNAAIGAFATKGAIQGVYYHWGNSAELGYVGSDASAKSPSKMANQELGWERTTQWNFGLDYSFLNNRIFGSLDYYTTDTKDLLMSMTIPSLTGYTSTFANVGRTSGWGIDLQITGVPVKTKDLEWDLTLTWSKDKSKIKELANGNKEDINNRWFVGEEIGVFYDYVYDGIWKTDQVYTVVDENGVSHDYKASDYNRKTGQIRVADLNGDGKIDGNNDRKIVGSVRPKWSGGLNSTLKYKNWDFSFFIYSRWGFTVPAGAANLDGRYMQRSLDYFVPGFNEDAKYYQPGINGESADDYQGSMNYQDGSFIKVRNISLGYTFDKKQLKSVGLNNLKIYAQVMNPFRLYSKCDWLDTDLMSYDNNATNFGSQTTLRSVVFGLNIGF